MHQLQFESNKLWFRRVGCAVCRKGKGVLFWLSCFSLLTACTNAVDQGKVLPFPVVLQQDASISPPYFMLKGKISFIHAKLDAQANFQPCGSRQEFSIHLNDDLYQAIMAMDPPNVSLFAEVIGYIKPLPTDSSDYVGNIEVVGMNRLSIDPKAGCHISNQPTLAFGEQPRWLAKFAHGGVLFQNQDMPKAQLLNLVSTEITSSQRVYQLDKGTLSFTDAFCRLEHAPVLYGWQAELTLTTDTERSYRGCAALSNQDVTNTLAGRYQGRMTTKQHPAFTVTLDLAMNHLAKISYQDANQTPIEETGFWQMLNEQQIYVVMTHRQQQFIHSERVFTLIKHKGQWRISAKMEKVNGRLRSLGEHGLTLFRNTNRAQ